MGEAIINWLIERTSVAHGYLLLLDAFATIVVVKGILWETKGPRSVHDVAHRLVVWGVAAETLIILALFWFDERISHDQSDKIIGLETRIAPRVLTAKQYDVIQTLRGKVWAVSVVSSPDVEPALFSAQLQEALIEAGVAVKPVPAQPGDRFVGSQICLPGDEDPKGTPLWAVMSAIGLNPGNCSIQTFARAVSKDIPLLVIGERPPFFPSGTPPFKYRAYPGFGVNP
jgi:hypothetical protein